MADIPQAGAIAGAHWPKGGSGQGFGRRGGRRTAYEQAGDLGPEERVLRPGFSIDIQGLNFTALPEKVQEVLTELMGEIEGLHVDLQVAEGRIAYLEQMVDQHAFMPVLNRRAILRDLAGMARNRDSGVVQDQAEPVGMAVLLYMANFDSLMRRLGLAAAEKALIHLARQMAGAVRASDRVGSVGGACLLAIMPTASRQGATHKMDRFLAVLAQRPLTVGGVVVTLEVFSAVVPVFPGDDPEVLLAEADSIIRQGRI